MIVGLGHVAYRIADLERSLDFDCRGLGLSEAFRLLGDDGKPWIVYIRLSGDNFIELFPGAGDPYAPPPGSAGFAHVCLRVDDLEATLEELRERGVPLDDTVRKGKSGSLQYWLTDPDGTRIELMQILDDSLQARSQTEASD
ncbi:VOC family protein [Candidatus Poribacteria bacterium]|nr:VOC family protein [Candidatus Poribacteria bacterium]